HLFTPSVANITTDHASHHTDEFQRLRNLFSSDSEHTMGLRTLFEEKSRHNQHHPHHHYVPNLPTIHSETSIGLNTLFNNKTVDNVTSSGESSMGLRTLFEENPNVVEGAGKTVASSNDTFLGIRSLFEEKSNADIRKTDASNVENKPALLKKKKMLIKLVHLLHRHIEENESLLHLLHLRIEKNESLLHLVHLLIEENDEDEEVVAPPPSFHPRERLQQHHEVGTDAPSMANIAAALDEYTAQNDKKRLQNHFESDS
uniref:Uncharacterized protein n=1 Tax=Panagrolaimus sp. PS1159 TaxID=55785 RepID=A0AC35FKV2_9BILA